MEAVLSAEPRPAPGSDPGEEEGGCAYLFDLPTSATELSERAALAVDRPAGGGLRRCGALRRCGSSYCPRHHALCHLRPGSAAEARRLCELERLARAVGGRSSPRGRPSRHFLERLERRRRPGPVRPLRGAQVSHFVEGEEVP